MFAPEEQKLVLHRDWRGLLQTRRITNPKQLTAPFGMEKIKNMVFHLGNEKASGPDGFPMSFYQIFRDMFKEDMWKVFARSFFARTFSNELLSNRSLVYFLENVRAKTFHQVQCTDFHKMAKFCKNACNTFQM